MFRRALILLAASSLLLCAFSVTLGVRSVWKHDRLQARIAGHACVLNATSGRLSVWGGSEAAADFPSGWFTFEADPYSLERGSDAPGPVSAKWYAAGFGYVKGWYPGGVNYSTKARYQMLVFPAWAAGLLTALLPAWLFPRLWRDWRRRRLTARGLCHACGYDVRNSPDRCPECGTPVLHAARRAG
jgi:hypothetical protein